MNVKIAITAALATGLLAACGAATNPIPQGSTAAGDTTAPAAAVSACDQVREAFLTGTLASQTKALKALKADKTADGTAREYAGYWLVRDAKSKDLRSMDQTVIVSSCGLSG